MEFKWRGERKDSVFLFRFSVHKILHFRKTHDHLRIFRSYYNYCNNDYIWCFSFFSTFFSVRLHLLQISILFNYTQLVGPKAKPIERSPSHWQQQHGSVFNTPKVRKTVMSWRKEGRRKGILSYNINERTIWRKLKYSKCRNFSSIRYEYFSGMNGWFHYHRSDRLRPNLDKGH